MESGNILPILGIVAFLAYGANLWVYHPRLQIVGGCTHLCLMLLGFYWQGWPFHAWQMLGWMAWFGIALYFMEVHILKAMSSIQLKGMRRWVNIVAMIALLSMLNTPAPSTWARETPSGLFLLHILSICANYTMLVAVLLHGALLMLLEKNLRADNPIHWPKYVGYFFDRKQVPSLEKMEQILHHRLHYLGYSLLPVMLSGMLMMHLQNTANARVKLILASLLLVLLVCMLAYKKRYGLGAAKLWYGCLILVGLWTWMYWQSGV